MQQFKKTLLRCFKKVGLRSNYPSTNDPCEELMIIEKPSDTSFRQPCAPSTSKTPIAWSIFFRQGDPFIDNTWKYIGRNFKPDLYVHLPAISPDKPSNISHVKFLQHSTTCKERSFEIAGVSKNGSPALLQAWHHCTAEHVNLYFQKQCTCKTQGTSDVSGIKASAYP